MSDIPDFPPVLERLLPAGRHDQIGAYALESLPAEERIAFEAHLRDCEDCQAELPIVLQAARTLRRAIVPDAEPLLADDGPAPEPSGPLTWVSARQAQIVGEVDEAPAPEETAVPEETESLEAGIDEETPIDDAAEPVADATDQASQDPDTEPADSAEEIVVADEADASAQPTTPEPFRSEILVDLPDADAIPDTDLIAAAAARVPEAAEQPASRRRRPKGRIAPGAQPTASQLAVAAPSRPSRQPWLLGGLGLLFGIGAILAALALAEQKGNLEEEIAFQNTQIEELNAQRDAYLSQTTAITWTLQPTTLGSQGSGGTVFADPAGTSAMITVFGMPAPGADQQYQVWYVLPDDSSEPGPALTLDSNGSAVALLTPDLSPYRAIAVTVEPASGSELPSTNPVLQAFFTT